MKNPKPRDASAVAERKAATNLAWIVVRLLLNPQGWRVDDLIGELGIKRSTFYKYVKQLRALPVAELRDQNGESLVGVVRDGEVRYLRLKRLSEPPERQNDFFERMIALRMVEQVASFLEGTALGRRVNALASEFKDHIRDRHDAFQHLLRNMDRAFVVLPRAPKNYREKHKQVETILQGLGGCYRLSVTYEVPGRKAWTRLLEPLTLLVHDNALYLLVRSPDDKYVYTLAVDRILEVKKTGQVFHYPSRQEYDPLDYTEGAFGVLTAEHAEPIPVELIFANKPWLKKSLLERHWHKTQSFCELPDGRLRMTFTVRSMAGVWPWIRSYGRLVEVVKPAEPDPDGPAVSTVEPRHAG